MKRLLFLSALFAMIGIVNAELLVNGDFEAGAGVGWSQWYGGNSGVGVPDPIDGDLCGGVWWSDDGIFQGIAIGPGTYTVSGEMLMTSGEPLGNNRIAVIKAEIGDGTNIWWTQELAFDASSPTDVWTSGSFVVDNTTAGATYLNINLFMFDQDGPHTGSGIIRYDNISVVPEPASLALLGLGGLLLRRKRR